MVCYHGSRLIGYNHEHMHLNDVREKLLVAAVTKTANPDFVTPELHAYYQMLESLAPRCMQLDDMRIFVANSGAEAVENAMKHCIAKTQGKLFVSFTGGFHGRTVFALASTSMPHNPDAHRTFRSFTMQSTKIKPPVDEADVMRAIEEVELVFKIESRCAGVIIEPIQGAGGHNIVVPSFMHALNLLCHAYDVPLIIDEIQTGAGASGQMWMSDSYNLRFPPECVVGGKRLGCGVVYMNSSSSMGLLDSTWGGTLVDMVRVCEEMSVVNDENLLEQIPLKTAAFMRGLNVLAISHPKLVINPRGVGLLMGFDVSTRDLRDKLVAACEDEKLLVLPAGTHAIRFRPSLGVTLAEVSEVFVRLKGALETLAETVQIM